MPQSRLELVKTLNGVGTISLDGRETPIRYTIRIYQELLEIPGGKEVPGLKSAAGQLLDLKHADAARAMGNAVRLTLEDGQKSDVIVTDMTGAFQVSGAVGDY